MGIELRHEIARQIAEKTMRISDTQVLSKAIAEYLVSENLSGELDAILREVINYRAKSGYIETVAVSANPLSKADLDDIDKLLRQEYPDAEHFVIDQRIDPTVVGGVKLEMPGEQLDLTLSKKLSAFKRLAAIGKE